MVVNPNLPMSPFSPPPFVQPTASGTGASAGAAEQAAAWERYIAIITKAMETASGFQLKQLEAQRDDALKGRENALTIARLSASTSRYGTDQQTMLQLRQLEQQQSQFQANHGLELAKTYAQFASTPDQAFAMNDFKSALGRVSQGYSPAPMASQGAPKAKTWEDFAALSQYGGGGKNTGDGGGSGDTRNKAIKAVTEAMPPSDGAGHDDQDWAALSAISALYQAGLPGSVERLGAPRRKIAQAGLARAGYDPAAVEYERMRGLPGQQSARLA